NFSVTWRIADASRYLFSTRNPEEAVKAVAESAMREVIGKTPLDLILTTGRGQAQLQTAELMQKTLDNWGAGVSVVEVQIRTVNPPQEAVAAFRDVQSADQDRASAVNEAKGDAAKIIQSAQGYREQSVRTAGGDAARFNSIYNEYRRSPQATRDRLYIETMQRVLEHSNKVVISGKGVTAPVILPPDVFRPRGGPNAAAAPAVQAQPAQPQAPAPGGQP
ncbi:MAG: FtsH protease activity modulator HflK, partial [Phenylobacterium sp.]